MKYIEILGLRNKNLYIDDKSCDELFIDLHNYDYCNYNIIFANYF